MNKRMKNILIMFFGTGINVLLGLITTPILTRIINPTDYGIASLLQTYINVIVSFCLLGLDQAYIRFYYAENTIAYKRKLTKTVLIYPLILALIVAVLIAFFGRYFIELPSITYYLIGLCVIVTVVETVSRLSVRLQQNSMLYSCLLIIHRLVYAATIITLVLLFDKCAVDSTLIGTSLSLVVIIIIGVVSQKSIWFGNPSHVSKEIGIAELLKYSYPFIFTSIVGWAFMAADKITLQYFSTYTEIGYYSAASTIVSLIAIIQTTFSTLWIPMAMETFENNPDNKDFYIRSLDYMTLVLFIVANSLVLIKDVFAWILGGNYSVAKLIFPCLLLHPIMHTLSETTVYGINFYKKTYWHIVISAVCCIFNICLNVVLVQKFGGKGAAISTGIAYILFFILRTGIAQKYYKVPFHLHKMSIVLVCSFTYYLYNTFYENNTVSAIFYGSILALIICLYKSNIYELLILGKNAVYSIRCKLKGDNM